MKDPYEKIVEMMREQGEKNNPRTVEVGTVKSGYISLNGMEINKNDYLKIDGSVSVNEGDVVALILIPNKNKYLLLGRVVEP